MNRDSNFLEEPSDSVLIDGRRDYLIIVLKYNTLGNVFSYVPSEIQNKNLWIFLVLKTQNLIWRETENCSRNT